MRRLIHLSKDIKVIGRGKMGTVLLGDLFGRKIVIKSPRKGGVGFIEREWKIAQRINTLREFVPNFVYTLGSFKAARPFLEKLDSKHYKVLSFCRPGPYTHLVQEYVEGQTLHNFIDDPTKTVNDFIEVYLQCLLALEIAKDKLGFSHMDLNAGNIIVKALPSPRKIEYLRPSGDKLSLKVSYLPMIFDFGLSFLPEIEPSSPEFSEPSFNYDANWLLRNAMSAINSKIRKWSKTYAGSDIELWCENPETHYGKNSAVFSTPDASDRIEHMLYLHSSPEEHCSRLDFQIPSPLELDKTLDSAFHIEEIMFEALGSVCSQEFEITIDAVVHDKSLGKHQIKEFVRRIEIMDNRASLLSDILALLNSINEVLQSDEKLLDLPEYWEQIQILINKTARIVKGPIYGDAAELRRKLECLLKAN